MKIIIISLVFLLGTLSAYAECNVKIENIDNKFEYTNKLVDFISSVAMNNSAEKSAFNNTSSASFVLQIVAMKTTLTDVNCFRSLFNRYDSSSKLSIRKANESVMNYLNIKKTWLEGVLDLLNSNNLDDRFFNNKLADLLILQKSADSKMGSATLSLYLAQRFEQSDDLLVDLSIYNPDDLNAKLALTNVERNAINKRIIMLSRDDLDFNISLSLALYGDLLGYNNKKVETIELLNRKK